MDHARPGATRANDPGIALQRCIARRSAHHTPDAGVNNSLLPGINKEQFGDLAQAKKSSVTYYKQRKFCGLECARKSSVTSYKQEKSRDLV